MRTVLESTRADGYAPKISVVVPLYNEEESIPQLREQLVQALEQCGYSFEVVIVDDGSRDRSFALLSEWAQDDPRVTVIRFRRNFGQTAAFSAGFDHATGEVVITMDADLQNDPSDIPKLMAKIEEGYDIVSGWRTSSGSFFRPQTAFHACQSAHLQCHRCAVA